MENIVIRKERKEDYEQISAVHIGVFRHTLEAELISNLRLENCFDADLSLVAEVENKIAGHILFTPVSIENTFESFPAVILAPLAVDKNYQGCGIGAKLIQKGIDIIKDKGFKLVLVSGHVYYDRFGFKITNQIFRPNPVKGKNIRVLELEQGASENVKGVIKYPKAFKPTISEWDK
jgi:predicted N-acetyltransferase YhbS